MRPGWALAALVALALAGCGARPVTSIVPAATPTPAPSALPTPSPEPTASQTPGRPVFRATVIVEGGANIRSGPGLDRSIVALAPEGSVQAFDGWYRHTDETPVPDADSGRIEAWSRDWYHLASGRGWIHSSTVDGLPPAGMPQMDPNSLPILIT